MEWQNIQSVPAKSYVCGYCNHISGSNKGFIATSGDEIYICSYCAKPTYFNRNSAIEPIAIQVPGPSFGGDVEYIPPEAAAVYREARNCMTVSAYTAVVMLCRKLLMHIAVAEGAPEKENFVAYIDYLASAGYIPLRARGWVDQIRKTGNDANHLITPTTRADAEQLISFSEMVLKLVYEYPGRVAPPPSTP